MDTTKLPVYLCMGSACHQQGVYSVLPLLEQLIQESPVNERVVLKGHLCLGPCSDGICVRVGEKQDVLLKVNPSNVESKFKENILPLIQKMLKEKT